MFSTLQNKKILLLFSLITLIIFNWSIGLWDQDEAAYAGFAKRMLDTGNFLIPNFEWSSIHRKPPLHFWFNVFWFKVFGYNEWSTRFSSVLSIIGTLILIWKIGGKIFGKKIGEIAAIVGASSILIFGLAKIAVTDADLMFFETLAILSCVAYFKLNNWRYFIGIFIGATGALLVKGPPVYIMCFGFIGLAFLFSKHKLKAIYTFLILLLAGVPLFYWGRMTWLADGGDFVTWLVDWYILKRDKPFATQTGPPGYFYLVFLVAFYTFSNLFIKGFWNTLKSIWNKEARNEDTLLLVFWIIPGWILYEFMPSKLPSYAIGSFAAVCIFIAKEINKLENQNVKEKLKVIPLILSLLIGLTAIVAGFLFLNTLGIIGCILIFLINLTISIKLFKSEQTNYITKGFQIILTVFCLFSFIVPSIDEHRSATKTVALKIAENNINRIVLTKNLQLPSLLFYLETNNVEIIHDYDENNWANHIENGEALLFMDNTNSYIENNKLEKSIKFSVFGWISDRGKTITYNIIQKK